MNPEAWPEFFLSVMLRSVLLAAAGTLFCLAVRRGSNRLRFAAAMAAIASLALLPLLLGILPRFEWAIFPVAAGESTAPPAFTVHPGWLPILLWFSGAALFFLRLIRGACAAHRLNREAVAKHSGDSKRILSRLKTRFGIRVPVRVAYSPSLSRPVVCGLLRPAILLPPQAIEWNAARLERVLAHELAHVARRDLWSQWFCQVVAALYWFNPLVWRLAAWQTREREISADEMALSVTGDNRAGYARELLAIATEPVTADWRDTPLPCAAAMLGATSRLEDRISCLFGAASPAGKLHRFNLVLGGIAALVIFAACSACDPVGSKAGSPWTEDEVRLRLSADPFPES